LFIILGVIVVVLVVAVILIINLVIGLVGKTAKLDYFEIGDDKIPTVKLALGEERSVVGINTTISGKVTTKKIEYEVSGSNQSDDMFDYYLCLRDDGFVTLTDIDFSGSKGTGVVGRNSVDDGYEIQLQIEYDFVGYTITILKQPGGITLKDSSDETEYNNGISDSGEPESSSGSSGESGNNNSVESNSGNNGSSGVTNTGAAVLTQDIFKIMDSGEYHMKVNMTTAASDEEIDFSFAMEYDIYLKDGMQAMIIDFMMKMRTVYRDGKTYTMYDDYEVMTVAEGTEDNSFEVTMKSDQLTYIGEDSEEFAGKTYKYDEFTNSYGTVFRYYVDGGVLKGIRSIDPGGSVTDMEILIFESSAPDSVFEIPTDYEIEVE